jgi:hypothetical protein
VTGSDVAHGKEVATTLGSGVVRGRRRQADGIETEGTGETGACGFNRIFFEPRSSGSQANILFSGTAPLLIKLLNQTSPK